MGAYGSTFDEVASGCYYVAYKFIFYFMDSKNKMTAEQIEALTAGSDYDGMGSDSKSVSPAIINIYSHKDQAKAFPGNDIPGNAFGKMFPRFQEGCVASDFLDKMDVTVMLIQQGHEVVTNDNEARILSGAKGFARQDVKDEIAFDGSKKVRNAVKIVVTPYKAAQVKEMLEAMKDNPKLVSRDIPFYQLVIKGGRFQKWFDASNALEALSQNEFGKGSRTMYSPCFRFEVTVEEESNDNGQSFYVFNMKPYLNDASEALALKDLAKEMADTEDLFSRGSVAQAVQIEAPKQTEQIEAPKQAVEAVASESTTKSGAQSERDELDNIIGDMI